MPQIITFLTMKIKYFTTLIAFLGLLMHCYSQNSSNFSNVYDSNLLFKMRTQVPDNAYASFARHFYVVTKAEQAHRWYPSLSKEEVTRVMKVIVPNTYDSYYTSSLRTASTKDNFVQSLSAAIGTDNYDYLLESCYVGKKAVSSRYYEVVNTMSSGGYAEEYPFELKGGKLLPLEGLENVASTIEPYIEARVGKKMSRSMASKYGATFINGQEYVLFSYSYDNTQDNIIEIGGYQYQVLAAYQPETTAIYYTTGDFGGEKTMAPENVSWQYLADFQTPVNNNSNSNYNTNSNNKRKANQGLLKLVNNSDNPYTVSCVKGDIVMQGHSETTLYLDYHNLYKLTIKQNSGFLLYPTVLYYDVQFDEDLTERTIKFPF